MKNKKQQILDYLMEDGISSTTRISIAIKSNTGYTLKYLHELEKENKISRIEKDYSYHIYWDIKPNKKRGKLIRSKKQ